MVCGGGEDAVAACMFFCKLALAFPKTCFCKASAIFSLFSKTVAADAGLKAGAGELDGGVGGGRWDFMWALRLFTLLKTLK